MKTKPLVSKETASILNDLIQITLSAQEGYDQAAALTDNQGLRSCFLVTANQRAIFAKKMQSLVFLSDEEPMEESGTLASVHQVWMKIREALTNHDEHALISECIRGETIAEQVFGSVVGIKPIPEEVLSPVAQQLTVIQKDLEMFKEFLANYEAIV